MQYAFIGAWNDRTADPGQAVSDGGILSFAVSPDGEFSFIDRVNPEINIGLLCVSHSGDFLYATAELVSGSPGRELLAYKIDKRTGKLTLLNRVPSEGEGPCYVSVDRLNRFAFAANYGGGTVAMFPLMADGSLGNSCDLKTLTGHSIVPWLQDGPHPHSAVLDPSERYLLVADRGCDLIKVYRIDYENGRLTESASQTTEAGVGPRYSAFSAELNTVYINGELNNTIHAYGFDEEKGALACVDSITTLPEGFVPAPPEKEFANNAPADIRVHKSGRFLYNANRGDNSIAIYSLVGGGKMTSIGFAPSRGEIPRAMSFDLSGDMLYVLNQTTGNVVRFAADGQTGALTPDEFELKLKNPVCIQFSE